MRDILEYKLIRHSEMGRVALYYHPVLDGDKPLLERLIDSSTWADFSPDELVIGRAAYFWPSNGEVSNGIHTTRLIQAKGICEHDGETSKRPSTEEFYPGSKKLSHVFDSKGNRTVYRETLNPLGGNFALSAEKEDYFLDVISNAGLLVPHALGFGIYLDHACAPVLSEIDENEEAMAALASHEKYTTQEPELKSQQLGFIWLGHPTKTTKRLHELELTFAERKLAYRQIGESMRQTIEQTGILNLNPHRGNFSIQAGDIYSHDFGSALRLADLTPQQAFGYLMHAIDVNFIDIKQSHKRLFNIASEQERTNCLVKMLESGMGEFIPELTDGIDSAQYTESFLKGFFGKRIKLTTELCYLFNHVGYGSRNPFVELSCVTPENLFRQSPPWESQWTTRKSWADFYNTIVPTLVKLSGFE